MEIIADQLILFGTISCSADSNPIEKNLKSLIGLLYIFFSNDTKRKHLSKDWLRKEFRITREKAGLNDSYGVAEDINNPNKWKIGEKKLYRLSTHSLRHYFISNSIKVGSTIIDVGINRVNDPNYERGYKFIGDLDNSIWGKAEFATPVPEGIGPMTVISLLKNIIKSTEYCSKLKHS